ncbi:hypothetical protein ETAA8_53480 [Anatilimnocola aggregata]|uniref:Uncharacterized protein n=1 Tax=Anatilimnocola aggregata TaxID=2528021 RepID=A0A517YJ28_9BACT|nr:hypothetical protein [Anatilimnocola aggregata]QDU30229.1 hypothetical protein ETAA8_53480 [Anatilimnocola aggregata]
MVTFAELNNLKQQQPFQPFRVTTVSHESYEVQHPGLILIGDEEVTIGLPHPSKPPPVAGEMVWLWLESIENVEMIGSASK